MARMPEMARAGAGHVKSAFGGDGWSAPGAGSFAAAGHGGGGSVHHHNYALSAADLQRVLTGVAKAEDMHEFSTELNAQGFGGN